MRRWLTVLWAALVAGACSNGSGGADASVDAAANDASEETVSDAGDGATCAPAGSDCTDPFACCSQSCHAKSLDDGGQITTCL